MRKLTSPSCSTADMKAVQPQVPALGVNGKALMSKTAEAGASRATYTDCFQQQREHPPQDILHKVRMALLSHPLLSPCPPACICHFSGIPILPREGTELPSTSRLPAPNTGMGWPGRSHIPVASNAVAFAKTLQSCV